MCKFSGVTLTTLFLITLTSSIAMSADAPFVFRDVGDEAGIFPHTAGIRGHGAAWGDVDGDGWPDLFVATFHNAGSKPSLFLRNDHGKFRLDPQEHLHTSGKLFAKLLEEKKIIYMAPGPTCDFDRDGRLDMFLPNWWIESRSLLLLRNETPSGHWLQVCVEGHNGVNRMGLGTQVNVYPTGQKDPSTRLGSQEIRSGYGYCSGQEAVAHFGLGATERVDLELILPHGKGKVVRKNIPANQRVIVIAKHAE